MIRFHTIFNTFATGWYAILSKKELRKINKPLAIRRFELDLVLWRNKNKEITALHDRCPHRSAKLSLGKISDDKISCPFHGFQFDAHGTCVFAPEFAKAIPGLHVRKFVIHEAFGMVWLYYGDTPLPFSQPLLSDISQRFKGRYAQTSRTWQTHITRAIENQLDYTHLPFVHKNTIGRNYYLPTAPRIELNDSLICAYLRTDQAQPTFTFIFPNIWILHISDKLQLVVYFVPVDEQHTKFYLTTYRSFLNFKFLNFLFNFSNAIILNQDRTVVESQGNQPSYLVEGELLMKHDLAIKHFRNIWQASRIKN